MAKRFRAVVAVYTPRVKITREAPMGSIEDWYVADGKNTPNYFALGTGVGFATVSVLDGPRFGFGGRFQGWYYGVYGFGGARGPNHEIGPEINGYTAYCSVLGTGYYVPGVAGTSTYNPGVYGQTESPSILPNGLIAGVIGTGNTQPGVIGWSRAGDGVQGATYTGTAILAESFYGQAVYGLSGAQSGITGISGTQGPTPVFDLPTIAGVYGSSQDQAGVIGTSNTTAGVLGFSNNVGVYGATTKPGGDHAGIFRGNVLVTGRLTVNNMPITAVPFPDGTRRALYCMGSPELWFEDFGTGKLKRGRAVVKLDTDFAKVIKRGDYRVFPTPEGDCRGLFVHRKSANTFEVRELMGGKSAIAFSYRIVGRRKDIKGHRRFAKIDTSLPVPARTRHKPPSRAGFRAFVSRFEKEARRRAPRGAKKMRERPSTMLSRDNLMSLMQQPEHSEAKGRRAHEYDHQY
jgi:hypothetical protein